MVIRGVVRAGVLAAALLSALSAVSVLCRARALIVIARCVRLVRAVGRGVRGLAVLAVGGGRLVSRLVSGRFFPVRLACLVRGAGVRVVVRAGACLVSAGVPNT